MPGASHIIAILILSCTLMFLRMVFVSLPDIAKIHRIESIGKNTQYWPLTFGIISTTNIIASLAVLMMVNLIYKAEK